MKVKLITVNGPPTSGKTDLKNYLIEKINLECPNSVIVSASASDYLYNAVREMFDISLGEFEMMKMNKDAPRAIFNGNTLRRTVVNLSEHFLKPQHGKDVLTKIVVKKIESYHTCFENQEGTMFVFTNIGYTSEFESMIRLTKDFVDEYFLVQTFREGAVFKGDSRHYIGVDGIDTRVKVLSCEPYGIKFGMKEVFEEIL